MAEAFSELSQYLPHNRYSSNLRNQRMNVSFCMNPAHGYQRPPSASPFLAVGDPETIRQSPPLPRCSSGDSPAPVRSRGPGSAAGTPGAPGDPGLSTAAWCKRGDPGAEKPRGGTAPGAAVGPDGSDAPAWASALRGGIWSQALPAGQLPCGHLRPANLQPALSTPRARLLPPPPTAAALSPGCGPTSQDAALPPPPAPRRAGTCRRPPHRSGYSCEPHPPAPRRAGTCRRPPHRSGYSRAPPPFREAQEAGCAPSLLSAVLGF
uniref:cuticle collagen 1-like n=1 Tax=Nyctereutes procyonoides TaxID=34880 RepID=UPI0024444F9A|nr:cuticle collagen 1-like [Nyctereutes procyonoides]